MRKTGLYGYSGASVDFEWPKEDDLLKMPMNEPIKMKDLQYKFNANNSNRFGGFRMIL